jgi:uncharacterized protein (DUF433 family)
MNKFDYRNIERVPGRCGGSPVIAGGCGVSLILGWHRMGMTVEEIVQQYPHIRPSDVHDALAYAYDHPDEIEADLAQDREAAAKLSSSSESLKA